MSPCGSSSWRTTPTSRPSSAYTCTSSGIASANIRTISSTVLFAFPGSFSSKINVPELISPAQPVMDIAALTHEPAPGVRVTCRMEGDAFEMEDQRNWLDASYKTYIRPLSKPWPYALKAVEPFVQRVEVEIAGEAPAAAGDGNLPCDRSHSFAM